MNVSVMKIVIPLVLVGAFLGALYYSLKKEPFQQSAVKTLATAQQAAAPLGFPVEAEKKEIKYQPQLQRLSAFERVQIPLARCFELVATSEENLTVTAMADGFIVFNGKMELWGKTIVVAHKLTDERIILSYYGNLKSAYAEVGKLIARGQPVGTSEVEKNYRGLYQSDGVVFPTKENKMKRLQIELDNFIADYNPDKVAEKSALRMLLESK